MDPGGIFSTIYHLSQWPVVMMFIILCGYMITLSHVITHTQSCDHIILSYMLLDVLIIFQPCSQNCLRTSDDVIAVIRGSCEGSNCRNFTLTNDRSLVEARSEHDALIYPNSTVTLCDDFE